jgi:hypothetical protein
MCAIAQVDYHYFYRQATSLGSYQIPTTSLIPNPSSDSEYVKTNHIFSQWVDGILSQFQTRYPRIFDCLFKPDPFDDQSVREFYIEIMHTNQPSRPNGPTPKDIMKARGMLQTHICKYNQANLFLAEVIKNTVTKE